jgi:S1-C subfamily serine protease
MNPSHATGLLGLYDGGEGPAKFLGSTFAYRSSQHFLTAAHCVGDVGAGSLTVTIPHAERAWPVATVERHPSADLAVVALHEEVPDLEPFWGTVSNLAMAEEFYAFGYPADVLGANASMPTPRAFVGHFQRFFEYTSFAGFVYACGEMSIPAPSGLSGGPLFRPAAPQMVTAVAADNLESTTLLDAVEEISTASEKRTIRYQRVISYGVAVLLHPLSDWLDERVPSQAALAERLQQRQQLGSP